MADKKELNINGAQYSAKEANAPLHPCDIIIECITYTINMAESSPVTGVVNTPMMTTYHVSASQHSDNTGAFIDHHAIGGVAGADCHVIEAMDCFVNIKMVLMITWWRSVLLLQLVALLSNSNRGPVILIMNQYAHVGKGTSIHSSPQQMEWYSIKVDGKSVNVGGMQCLTTLDGFAIPLDM